MNTFAEKQRKAKQREKERLQTGSVTGSALQDQPSLMKTKDPKKRIELVRGVKGAITGQPTQKKETMAIQEPTTGMSKSAQFTASASDQLDQTGEEKDKEMVKRGLPKNWGEMDSNQKSKWIADNQYDVGLGDDFQLLGDVDILKQKRSRMEQSLEDQRRLNELAMQDQEAQVSQEKERGERARGAMQGSIMGALGRDSFGYNVNKEQLKGFDKAFTQRLEALDRQRQTMVIQTEANERALEQAIADNDQQAVNFLQDKLNAQYASIEQANVDLMNAAANAEQAAMSAQSQKIQDLANIGEFSVGMSDNDLYNLAEEYGISYPALKSYSEQKNKEAISEQLQKEYEATQNGLKTIGTLLDTPEIFANMKDVPNAAKSLATSFNIDEGVAASVISSSVDIMAAKDEDRALKIQQAKATLANTQAQTAAKYSEMSGSISGSYDPTSTGYVVEASDVLEVGKPMPKSFNAWERGFGGQCSAGVNDMFGFRPGLFGSTFQSKIRNKNVEATETPQVGDVFISRFDSGDEFGHVGWVKAVVGDTVTLADFNKPGEGIYDERSVPLDKLQEQEGIEGYFRPKKAIYEGVYKQDQLYTRKPWLEQQKDAATPEIITEVNDYFSGNWMKGTSEDRDRIRKEIDKAVRSGKYDLTQEPKKLIAEIKRDKNLFTDTDMDNFDTINEQVKDRYKYNTGVQDSVKKGEAIKNAVDSGSIRKSVADISTIYEYIKSIDPESVVREGEVSLFNQAKSIIDKFQISISQVSDDPSLLTDDIRDAIFQLSQITEAISLNRAYDELMMFRGQLDERGLPLPILAEDAFLNKLQGELARTEYGKQLLQETNEYYGVQSDIDEDDDLYQQFSQTDEGSIATEEEIPSSFLQYVNQE